MTSDFFQSPARYQVGDLMLDTGRRRVVSERRALKLGPLSYDLLCALIEAAPNIAGYDALADAVWGNRFVSHENIAQRVKLLRRALADHGRYVEVVRGHGYRLTVPVTPLTRAGGAPGTLKPTIKAGAAVAITLILLFGWRPLETVPKLSPDTAVPNSIVVLPFDDLNAGRQTSAVAVRIHAATLMQLSQITALQVLPGAATGTHTRRPRPLREFATRSNVANVLAGTVHYDDKQVRVTARLIDGVTGSAVWSGIYELLVDDGTPTATRVAARISDDLAAALAWSSGSSVQPGLPLGRPEGPVGLERL